MRPKVILHNAASVDGRVHGFPIDLGLFYGLAARWKEDAALVGCDTLRAADRLEGVRPDPADAPPPPRPAPSDRRPLLVVVDSRGRLRTWNRWRSLPYWRDAVALCSESTPARARERLDRLRIRTVVAGRTRVDLARALAELHRRFGVRVLRVDSGGTLNGALLRAGLVDEVSLLVHPALVGGRSPASIFRAPDLGPSGEPLPARLREVRRLQGGVVWLRYALHAS